ncbi:hypothetical protein Q785_06200 [Ornithobacterium rhinotracheale ORT-UMN 88]|nr:hypothetical protein Q785_06200 [Ornithobacterium rhinotracheale ORT-UMN 88]
MLISIGFISLLNGGQFNHFFAFKSLIFTKNEVKFIN